VRYDWVSFTTDYGTSDGFVAACKGVVARIAPSVRVLDVTHDVEPQNVRRGGAVLAHTVGYLPTAVHLAVVDPGVGSGRRGVVVVAADGLLVGPDNGLLVPAAEALGGVVAAYELVAPRFRLPEVSMTFHGRDIFAPAVAHLANGVAPVEFGPAVDDLVRLPAAATSVADGRLSSEIVWVDRFGNVQLAAGPDDLAALGVRPGDAVGVRLRRSAVDGWVGRTFSDVPPGSLLVHVDSAGQVAVAVNGGSAAEALGGQVGEVAISPIA
jgi:S-adenosyl-L-methionine hydrolase (adenosine-forming)